MLEVRNLNVSYDKVQVLWDISLSVAEGKKTGIIGSNGAGKTTFLNTVMGIKTQYSGEIEFIGQSVSKLPCHKRVEAGISLVPEGRMLFSGLTVEENLRMGSLIGKDDKKKRRL